MLDLGPSALADRLGQLAQLLAQPGDRRRDTSIPVAVAVGALDHVLQLDQIHAPDRIRCRLAVTRNGHPIGMGTEKRAVVNPERTDAAEELDDRVDVDEERPDRADQIADRAADAAADDDVEVVAAVGGDGTQRTVAEALAGTDTELAIVPGGTVNLLGRVHGIESIDDAAEAIERGEAHPFDLARCDGHAYLLNSSSGLDAAMIAAVDDKAKRFGRLGYTAVGLLELVRATPSHVAVVVDGETMYEGDALTVMVLNVGERGSATFRIAPDAATDDGLLDVVVVTGSRRAYVRAGWSRFRKRLPAETDARIAQGRDIEVRWSDDVAVQCDGDPVESRRSIHYTVDPGAVAIRS